jgi:hypothetical protein
MCVSGVIKKERKGIVENAPMKTKKTRQYHIHTYIRTCIILGRARHSFKLKVLYKGVMSTIQQQLALSGVDAALKLALEVLPPAQVMHLVKETLLPLECVVKDDEIVETPQGYRLTLQPLGTCHVHIAEKPAPNTFFTINSGLTQLSQKITCFTARQNEDTGWVSVPLRRPTSWSTSGASSALNVPNAPNAPYVSGVPNVPNLPNTPTVQNAITASSSGSASTVRSMPAHGRPYPSSYMPRKYSSEPWRCEPEGSWRQQMDGKDGKGTTKGTCPKGSWREAPKGV